MPINEDKDFEQGIFWVACPYCGKKQIHAKYEVHNFFGCIYCGEYAWLRYEYLDREHGIIYGLKLVQDP